MLWIRIYKKWTFFKDKTIIQLGSSMYTLSFKKVAILDSDRIKEVNIALEEKDKNKNSGRFQVETREVGGFTFTKTVPFTSVDIYKELTKQL